MNAFQQLTQRVTLLWTTSQANSQGREERHPRTLGLAWANIRPVTSAPYSRAWARGTVQKAPPQLYEVCIRERKKLAEEASSEGRHECINALRWKGRELTVLSPFLPAGEGCHYWKALCQEKGENHG